MARDPQREILLANPHPPTDARPKQSSGRWRTMRRVGLVLLLTVLLGWWAVYLAQRCWPSHQQQHHHHMGSVEEYLSETSFVNLQPGASNLQQLVGYYYVPEGDLAMAKMHLDAGRKFITRAQLPNKTRVIPPGSMVTMDYVEDRLNVYLDPENKIKRAKYG